MVSGDELAAGDAAELAGDFLAAAAAYRVAAEGAEGVPAAEAHFRMGRLAWKQVAWDDALRHFEEARAIAVQLGLAELRARTENGIGAVHYAMGAYAQARASYNVALELTDDPGTQGKILLNLGVIANIEGDFDAARACYARSRTVFEQLGDEGNEALALHNMGMLHADRGELPEAEHAYARCLELFERQGNRQMIANVLLNRSELLAAREALGDAVASCDLAISIYAQLGDPLGRGEALRWKGHALRRMGNLPAARQALSEAARIAERMRVPLLEAEASVELGAVELADSAPRDARTRLERARSLFETLGAHRDAEEAARMLEGLG